MKSISEILKSLTEQITTLTNKISSFKNVGNTSTPIYFDENGIPKPVTNSGSGGTGQIATSVTWTKIENKPTTLAGYGITDAQPAINLLVVDGQLCITYDDENN